MGPCGVVAEWSEVSRWRKFSALEQEYVVRRRWDSLPWKFGLASVAGRFCVCVWGRVVGAGVGVALSALSCCPDLESSKPMSWNRLWSPCTRVRCMVEEIEGVTLVVVIEKVGVLQDVGFGEVCTLCEFDVLLFGSLLDCVASKGVLGWSGGGAGG